MICSCCGEITIDLYSTRYMGELCPACLKIYEEMYEEDSPMDRLAKDLFKYQPPTATKEAHHGGTTNDK